MDKSKRAANVSPGATAGPVSRLLFWWLKDTFKNGMKKDLTVEDLYDPLKGDYSEALGDELEKNWSKELLDSKSNGREPSLTKAIYKTFFWSYMAWGFLVFIQAVILRNLQPFALTFLIAHFKPLSDQSVTEGYLHGLSLNIIALLSMVINHHSILGCMIVGMRLRVACCSLIYRKILRLNRVALGKTAAGQVVNLMSNDVNRFDIASVFFHYLWIMPFQCPLAAYLMWDSVQIAAFAGITVLVIQALIIQGYLSRLQTKMRKRIAVVTDDRIKMMSEIIAGIQVIKMYAWEKPFEKLVAFKRRIEMKLIGKTNYIRGFSLALMVFTERTALYVTIIIFIFAGNTLSGEIVFSMAQYYNLLQLTVSIMFPYALSTLGESRISIKRLQEFLSLDEKVTKAVFVSQNGTEKNSSSDIVIKKASGSWIANPIVNTLSDVNINIKSGEFCAIVGPVGAGKSSLLQLLLGELPLKEGTMDLGGSSIAYSSQEPWLFLGTVKQNILFGQPFDKERYWKVVKACSLERDFDQFPRGDQTIVGERGVSLSGGQRARINLARAVYRQADVYLMDDPLSAVDTHVGRQLVKECLGGFLADKTRILVTHQLHHLRAADKIILLQNGRVQAQGTYDEVSGNNLFSELMAGDDENQDQDKLQKQKSIAESVQSPEDQLVVKDEEEPDDEEEEEERKELMEKGGLAGSVYKQYLQAGGGFFILFLTFFMVVLAQLITSGGDLYLAAWSNNEEQRANLARSASIKPDNQTTVASFILSDNSTVEPLKDEIIENATAVNQSLLDYSFTDRDTAISVYTALIIACIIFTVIRSLLFFRVCIKSSINLHDTMFENILQATMRFFDINPSGRILNRFSKDMGSIDELLPRMFVEAIQIFMVGLGILTLVAIKNPYMIIAMAVIGAILYKMTRIYLKTAQDIKRLEGVTKSPVFSHLAATLTGLSTIRACGAQEMLKKEFDKHQDLHTASWYISLATNTAFGLWLSIFCCIFVAIVSFTFLIIGRDNVQPGDVGLAVSQSLIMTGMLQHGIKQATDVITQMTSVERVLQYTKLPKEIGLNGPAAPAGWPSKGRIEFVKMFLKYYEGGEPVLKDLNVVIESGWKVGIVGRTGAGKSSLISALFRLAIVEGEIKIDGKDTKDIKLNELRSRISIIPQEPMLFSESLRHNLDPFSQQSDVNLWEALEAVELKDVADSLSNKVSEGGSNFSAGQRQLLCLARAIVKNNNILVLDEATANVDLRTDFLIQNTIRKKFNKCTVLTIAHRLNTVMDSDRIIVMDRGELKEFQHPHELLQNPESLLSQMVAQLGKSAEKNLKDVAREAYKKHIKYIEEPAD